MFKVKEILKREVKPMFRVLTTTRQLTPVFELGTYEKRLREDEDYLRAFRIENKGLGLRF